MNRIWKAAVLSFAFASRQLSIQALSFEPLDEPIQLWVANAGSILDSNGVYITPDDKVVVTTTVTGVVYGHDALSGEQLWTFQPYPDSGTTIRCDSGVTFHYKIGEEFMVYSVVENPNSDSARTRVIGLNANGVQIWQSILLEGINAGNAQISSDGRFVFLTHNSNMQTIGHFTVFDTDDDDTMMMLPMYTEFNRTNPFSPPGIFHSPSEGYYDGGQFNTNDILVWSFAPKPLDQAVGTGATFAFQFQTDPSISSSWTILGDTPKNFQAISAPVLTNEGRSLYWSVSRSQFRSWVGEAGKNMHRFNRGSTRAASFPRGVPSYQASFNTPSLSSDPYKPMVFAASAAPEFIKFNYLMEPQLKYNTTTVVKNTAHVTPNDEFVYFTEFGGTLHMAYTETLIDHMIISEFGELVGDFAMNSDGTVVYIGAVQGTVQAIQLGEVVTMPPTQKPTGTLPPTKSPTKGVVPITGIVPFVSIAPFFSPAPSEALVKFVEPTQIAVRKNISGCDRRISMTSTTAIMIAICTLFL